MKNFILTLFLIFGISSTLFAQEEIPRKNWVTINGWKLNSTGLDFGVNFDSYSNLKIEQMKNFAIDPRVIERDLSNYRETAFPNTAAANFAISVGFVPIINEKNINDSYYKPVYITREIVLDIEGTAGKESFISYEQETHHNLDSSTIKTLGYCNLENEIAISGTYLFKLNYKKFAIYSGIGANTGTSFANRLMFWEDEMISYRSIKQLPNGNYSYDEVIPVKSVFENIEAYNSFYTRLFIPFGVEFNISNRFLVHASGRIGKGYQHGYNGESLVLKATGNAQLGVRYKFLY